MCLRRCLAADPVPANDINPIHVRHGVSYEGGHIVLAPSLPLPVDDGPDRGLIGGQYG